MTEEIRISKNGGHLLNYGIFRLPDINLKLANLLAVLQNDLLSLIISVHICLASVATWVCINLVLDVLSKL